MFLKAFPLIIDGPKILGLATWQKQVNQFYWYSTRLQAERSHKDKLFDDCFQAIALRNFFLWPFVTLQLEI